MEIFKKKISSYLGLCALPRFSGRRCVGFGFGQLLGQFNNGHGRFLLRVHRFIGDITVVVGVQADTNKTLQELIVSVGAQNVPSLGHCFARGPAPKNLSIPCIVNSLLLYCFIKLLLLNSILMT